MIERKVMENIPLAAIKLNDKNPRVNDSAVNEVIKSIKESGYISPIIIDETDMILAGNTRYKAIIKMGGTIVPMVIKVSGLTQEQKERFILADNKTQEFAEWDWAKLGVYTEELLKDVGFSANELDRILKQAGRRG
jgi:ParB-like chromosome segregation protein Spo0J